MSNVAESTSDRDDMESVRIQRVAAKNDVVFETLFKALGDRVSIYDERHPQDIEPPKAVSIFRGPFLSSKSSLRIQKNIEPLSSLTLDFPINSGAMHIELLAKAGQRSGAIRLDVVSDAPTYYFDGKGHSADTLADLLFEAVLSPKESLGAGRKIGFV